MSLQTDTDIVATNLLIKFLTNFCEKAGPLVLATLALEVFPLGALLNLCLVNG